MVANSFDLWQKDAFFSAAEEVQESADMYVFIFIFPFMGFTFWIQISVLGFGCFF